MAAIGMGAVYRITSDLRRQRYADPGEHQRLLDRWFHPYAAALTAVVNETPVAYGRAVKLSTCTLTPRRYSPTNELDQSAPRPGVCIGTDPTHTPASLTSAAFKAFAGVGGGVGRNVPFAGTYVPLSHWRRTTEVLSVMIEIRRDLYQSEPAGAPMVASTTSPDVWHSFLRQLGPRGVESAEQLSVSRDQHPGKLGERVQWAFAVAKVPWWREVTGRWGEITP